MKRAIILTWPEAVQAAQVGCMRQIQNLKNGLYDRYGAEAYDGWTFHVEGACGEIVVAKFFDRYWSGSIGDLKAADVGPLQVRTTKPGGDLRLHKRDEDDKAFILVTGRCPNYEIVGWLQASDGKHEQYWKDPTGKGRPAYFVPQNRLNQIETLVLET